MQIGLGKLTAGILICAALLLLLLHKKVQTTDNFKIEAVGLDEFGIYLETPYGMKSIHHALIRNDSPHHLIACDLVFQFITEDGEIQPARKVVAFSYLLKASQAQRNKLLLSHPGIAPHSKMLLGMGVEPDLVRVYDELPALGEASVKEVSKVRYQKLVVRINAVVLENGEAIGPKANEFLTHLKEVVQKEDSR